jgi:hypothetical protein
MRRVGAPAYESFIAGNEARLLAQLGRYDEAESLGREALEQERSMRAVPGIVNVGAGLLMCLTRRGRYREAQALGDELLPLARQVGGGGFLGRVLVGVAELEETQGNLAAARQTLAEAVDTVFGLQSVYARFYLPPLAARLLPAERVERLLEELRPLARHGEQEASLRMAEAELRGDRDAFREAAELYRGLELPFEEAQCRLEAGDHDRAREIIEKLGLHEGPLGARLRELSG